MAFRISQIAAPSTLYMTERRNFWRFAKALPFSYWFGVLSDSCNDVPTYS